ncbi:MAG: response regulator transcription factor [Bacteroidota bacterium]
MHPEKEIAILIADDKTNKEIARQLFINEGTLETHRKSFMQKTQTGTVVRLLKYARKNGHLYIFRK